MAKAQFDNPEQQKILGVCGKLKCCLKYEYQEYLEAIKSLPSIGLRIRTARGDGTVLTRNLIMRMVTVQKDDGERVSVGTSDILN
jgi:cell fate regulator YaaT (PSP1 superfamily)